MTDQELLERFTAHHDESAFEALVQRHGPLVLGVCQRVLGDVNAAEDAFQATFLILARKARTIRWHKTVRNWLYQVAFRTASEARVQRAKRLRHEREAGTMLLQDAGNTGEWEELRLILDEELYRLPEKFRMPLLLCYLHGKTRDDAAQELGWTEGAVKGRLERGRDILRNRLTRRGLSLATATLPMLLAQGTVSALPEALLDSTMRVAVQGIVSAPVAVLSKGVVQAMFWAKIKLATAMLVAASVIGASGILAFSLSGANEPPDKAEVKSDQEKLQGTWTIVKYEVQGKEVPEGANAKQFQQELKAGKFTITFTGDEMIFKSGDNSRKGTYKLDAAQTPKWLDLTTPLLMGLDGITEPGIYALEGDTLKICIGEKRPTKFETSKDARGMLLLLKREKL